MYYIILAQDQSSSLSFDFGKASSLLVLPSRGTPGCKIKKEAAMRLVSDAVLDWLLEKDDPGARYLALRDVLRLPADDPELERARQAAHGRGPISAILDHMHAEGYWERSGAGYNPKYRSAVWSLIALAQLGARKDYDPRLERACEYCLEHALTAAGQFSTNGTPSGTIDCLQGNLIAALLDLGVEEARLDPAFEWMARTVTGEDMAPSEDKHAVHRYYAYKCGPLFRCGANGGSSCAWGATKVMLAFGKRSLENRTPLIEAAIREGVGFLFSVDPALATYPTRVPQKPSPNWWKFGFPVFYITDLLQMVEALVLLGYGADPRLEHSLDLVRSKQDETGRWRLEYDYTGKTWLDFGKKKEPSKWVTIRALKILQ
jgi:hypothetical protein